jgi:RNA recognition motif-containing protein
MGRTLYVSNRSDGMAHSTPEQMFGPDGTVQSARVILDRDSGRSKGFGFVEMSSAGEAQAAIAALNGKEVDERALTVNEAKPRERGGGGTSATSRRRTLSTDASVAPSRSGLHGVVRRSSNPPSRARVPLWPRRAHRARYLGSSSLTSPIKSREVWLEQAWPAC